MTKGKSHGVKLKKSKDLRVNPDSRKMSMQPTQFSDGNRFKSEKVCKIKKNLSYHTLEPHGSLDENIKEGVKRSFNNKSEERKTESEIDQDSPKPNFKLLNKYISSNQKNQIQMHPSMSFGDFKNVSGKICVRQTFG
jgi:hypothetical protein